MRRMMLYLFATMPVALLGCSEGVTSRSTLSPSSVTSAVGVHHEEGATAVAATATVHVTNDGFRPEELTIAAGGTLTFINDTTRLSWPRSDPHEPGGHSDCPEFEAVGKLKPGQSGTTGNITHAECGFHDHLDDPDPIEGQVRTVGGAF